MSTRANIILKDESDELIFYRHSDGYPEGALPTLEKFLGYVKDGSIRDNVSQSAGWLILFGHQEYAQMDGDYYPKNGLPHKRSTMGWKVGAIEPTEAIHGDIEYLYVIDLKKKEIRHKKLRFDDQFNVKIPATFYKGKFNRA
jgi:hypothetical protein